LHYPNRLQYPHQPWCSHVDVRDAGPVGFPTTKITGLYDLGPLNQLLRSDGQPQVSTS